MYVFDIAEDEACQGNDIRLTSRDFQDNKAARCSLRLLELFTQLH